MSETYNPGRDRILERIRAGLRAAPGAPTRASRGGVEAPGSPTRASRGDVEAPPSPAVAAAAGSAIFDPVTDPRERFQQEAKANLMECLPAADAAASAQNLAQVLDSLPPGEIFVQDDPALRRLLQAAGTARPIRWSSQGAPAEASQATVTLARALIAQTGSVLVTAACGGRGASVVAPCHIVFATTDQLVPDLETALAGAARDGILNNQSFACVISGSSRTADIEKILVQGAHGPRRLVVILEGRN